MRRRFWLGAALAVILSVAGLQGIAHATGNDEVKPQSEKPGSPAEYTPVEYFDGIFFGVGPIVEEVPGLHPKRSPEDLRERAHLAEEIRSVIDKESPEFTERFARAVVSGDHVEVRESLTAGAKLIGEAYAVLFPGEPPPGICGKAKECDMDLAEAQWDDVGAAVALPVAVAVVVWKYLWVWDDDDDSMPIWHGELGLYLDEITHIVVRALTPMHR